jgi:6,7-dimethyl-8-ribityllumazine synthase
VKQDVRTGEHAPGDLRLPERTRVIEGSSDGARRSVAIVVSRFNGDVTTELLEAAVAELEEAGVARERIDVLTVPGAFELPLGAMALAKTRRYSCIVALGCVIRGETPHFDYVAAEAASGLQLAALEAGVPGSYRVLQPPSTKRCCPVMKLAAGDARKVTAPTTSSGLPTRPSGVSSQRW